MPSGTNQVNGHFHSSAHTSRIDYTVGSHTIPFHRPIPGITYYGLNSIILCYLQPGSVCFQTNDGYITSAQPGHRSAQYPDRSRTNDQNTVTWFDFTVFNDSIIS